MKFFTYQTLLFSTLLVINVFVDKYLSKPFTIVDLLAIIFGLPFLLIVVSLIAKLYKRNNDIRVRTKILLTIGAFLTAVIGLAVLESIWFDFTGKMLFMNLIMQFNELIETSRM